MFKYFLIIIVLLSFILLSSNYENFNLIINEDPEEEKQEEPEDQEKQKYQIDQEENKLYLDNQGNIISHIEDLEKSDLLSTYNDYKLNILNENNFKMGEKSILRSVSNILTKEECFNKFSKSDINGVSFNNKTNECRMYFYAEKGLLDPNYESFIFK